MVFDQWGSLKRETTVVLNMVGMNNANNAQTHLSGDINYGKYGVIVRNDEVRVHHAPCNSIILNVCLLFNSCCSLKGNYS